MIILAGRPEPEVSELQVSMKFQLLSTTKMLKNKNFSCFRILRCCFYHVNVKMPTDPIFVELDKPNCFPNVLPIICYFIG